RLPDPRRAAAECAPDGPPTPGRKRTHLSESLRRAGTLWICFDPASWLTFPGYRHHPLWGQSRISLRNLLALDDTSVRYYRHKSRTSPDPRRVERERT